MEDDFWNEYYNTIKKLNDEAFIYEIDGKEVSEKEFIKYILDREEKKK